MEGRTIPGDHPFRQQCLPCAQLRGQQGQYRGLEDYGFTVSHQGKRWYLSAGLPKSLGGNFIVAGFEITDGDELVIYNLDVERIVEDLGAGQLDGETVDSDQGKGALVRSPLAKVFAYLNDPANSDVFVEAARFQRVTQ